MDPTAKLIFELAQQQKISISKLMGFNKNCLYSYNEILWWIAYSRVRPLEADRTDLLEARIMTSFAGGDAKEYMINWFDPMNDEEYKKQCDAETVEELKRLNNVANN